MPKRRGFWFFNISLPFFLFSICLIASCSSANLGSDGGGVDDPRTTPLGPRTLTFVNLCKQVIYVAAFGNNDPSGTDMTTNTCTFTTPVKSPCRCKSDTDCRANEYCGQIPNRTGVACSSDSDCNTAEGQFCDSTFDPSMPECSFRLCSFVPADPNKLAKEIQPTVSCSDNSACSDGEWCNTFTNTCFSLPSDGGNGWEMAMGSDPVPLTFPEPWAGRFWARTGCDTNTFICDTGQCNGCIENGEYKPGECAATTFPTSLHCAVTGQNPATLAEVNMQVFMKGDFYDVSNVDSGNISIEMMVDPTTYDALNNPQAVSNTNCNQESDCVPLFGAFIWKCDTNLGKCVNPFTCGSPGCNDAGACTAQGIQASLLSSCPWDASTDFAIPEAGCNAALKVMVNGNYVGCNSPNSACKSANPPPPAQLNCDGTSLDLYGCTGTNAQSCFSTGAGANCCGCPSWANTAAPGSCQNTNPSWTGQVEPLITSFNTACPTSYSFPFDDAIKLFSCQAKDDQTHLNYTITFCPQN